MFNDFAVILEEQLQYSSSNIRVYETIHSADICHTSEMFMLEHTLYLTKALVAQSMQNREAVQETMLCFK